MCDVCEPQAPSPDIAGGEKMLLKMQDFDFAQSNQFCPNLTKFAQNLINFAQKNLLRDADASTASVALRKQ